MARMTTKAQCRDVPHHNVYVIELKGTVRLVKKFALANPGARLDKPCLYVGLTGLPPEERFNQHMSGIKAAKYVKRYGIRLKPRYFQKYNPMTYDDAKKMEVELTRRLRNRGFAVWQN
jgi:hypothetical protein